MNRLKNHKRRIIIHLGGPKTGSTSFQVSLAANRKRFFDAGLFYLGPRGAYRLLYPAFLDDPMQLSWIRVGSKDQAEVKEKIAAVLDELRGTLSRSPRRDILVSNENLCFLPEDGLKSLRDFFLPFGEVNALYCYRQIQSLRASTASQRAKNGLTTPLTFDQAIARVEAIPQRIVHVFTREETTFCSFEFAAHRGLVDSYLAAAHLPTLATIHGRENRENPAISAPAIEALFSYNARYPRGNPLRSEDRVRELMSIPGPPYTAPPLTSGELERYRTVRDRVASLGVKLDPVEKIG